ncbi:radical SAM protein [Pseudodesulfovibrio thermohalotolerans]|uniref:radical SAM protein n=1 Tax=Pseudodesulfovibrio thermohalotolerans TaxID=2880651 RepID=UPI00244283D2|nr:radical SAM protein [Pseudodesulfovibrio thermohalotolerans]WFS61741.1 radical SAM protein [Pseudodesulfovibrio thermohalotolerans]
MSKSNVEKYASHPCFGMAARKTVGRLHLPVAPRANARARFSDGAFGRAVSPEEALARLDRVIEDGVSVSVVGITGPGDPLAVPEPTLRTLRMVREKYPDMTLCLTTLGLSGAECAGELAGMGVSHVTVLVDAVEADVAEKLYAWIRPSTRTLPLKEAAGLLVEGQARAVSAFKEAGLTVKINTTVYPGLNAGHVERIAEVMSGLGADVMALTPFCPKEGAGEGLAAAGDELLAEVRDRAARHIDIVSVFDECGAGLVGLESRDATAAQGPILPRPTKERPNVAVVSSTGMDVDLHLGHAVQAMVYGPRGDGPACLLEVRDLPEPGSGSERWESLAEILSDCFVLLAASAGENPRRVLSGRGLSVLVTDGGIEGTVDALYGGGKKGKKNKRQ